MNSHESAKDEIKRVADIVELVGQYVQLRKAGRNYVGLCPFHAEKDPSFTVNPERQTFHCFGCKKGGDVFSFRMEYHSATFPEALRDLAEKYNVTLSAGFSPSEEKKKAEIRDALFRINERAADYFQSALGHRGDGRAAREYLDKRSLRPETIEEFKLGFAPERWDGLVSLLEKRDVDLGLAAKTGLVIQRKSGGYYDRFRGRIIFPILDMRRQVVGFGGRVMDDSLPKYLNTPETPLFRKGETLYGLHAAHKAIRAKGRALIVEGYMDCLALRGHGLEEVVATLGTALTPGHVRKLKGYAREALLVFDSDEAGKAAALKSLPLFLNEGLSAKAVILPEGSDPDSFVNEKGLERFLEILEAAVPIFDFFLEQRLVHDEADIEGKVRALKEILPFLSELGSRAQISMYAGRVSERLGIKEDVVLSELESFRKKPARGSAERDMAQRLTGSRARKRVSDIQFLNLLVHCPESVCRLAECEWKILLSDPAVVEIADTIFDTYSREGKCSPESVQDVLKSEAARKQLREALLEPAYYSSQTVEQAIVEIEEKIRGIGISASIRKAKERGDLEGLNELLKMKARGNPIT